MYHHHYVYVSFFVSSIKNLGCWRNTQQQQLGGNWWDTNALRTTTRESIPSVEGMFPRISDDYHQRKDAVGQFRNIVFLLLPRLYLHSLILYCLFLRVILPSCMLSLVIVVSFTSFFYKQRMVSKRLALDLLREGVYS